MNEQDKQELDQICAALLPIIKIGVLEALREHAGSGTTTHVDRDPNGDIAYGLVSGKPIGYVEGEREVWAQNYSKLYPWSFASKVNSDDPEPDNSPEARHKRTCELTDLAVKAFRERYK